MYLDPNLAVETTEVSEQIFFDVRTSSKLHFQSLQNPEVPLVRHTEDNIEVYKVSLDLGSSCPFLQTLKTLHNVLLMTKQCMSASLRNVLLHIAELHWFQGGPGVVIVTLHRRYPRDIEKCIMTRESSWCLQHP